MAIVGTAYVRLRIIGDKLKKDIGDSVSKAVDSSTADLDKVGKDIGSKISEGTSKEVERTLGSSMSKIADDAGTQIGRRMADNLSFSLRDLLPKRLNNVFTSLKPRISKAGDELGEAFGSFRKKIEKQFGGGGEGGGLGGILMAAIGPIITILPSVLSGAGAVIGAYAATAVTAVASIGPAAAGAAVGALAAFSAIKISAGLVGLAMKYPSDALEDFQKRAETFKGLIATPIQDGLLSGLNASMRLLSPVISALEPQLRGLGTVVGDIAIGFADAIRQGEMMDRIGRILETNNQFVKDAGGGVSQLGQAFIILLDHLRPVTAEIGEMIGQFGGWALGAINAASASGQLDSWINRMWASFKRLMGIAVDFGIGLYNVFSAAMPAAGNMTNSLENIARKFREWTGDEANQQRMVIFFEKMRTIVAQVNDILGDLASSGLRALEDTDVSSLSTGLETLRSLGPPIAQMFNAIKEAAGPKLLDAFQSFADIITNLANSGVLGILSSAFANLLAIIAQVLAIPGVGELLGWVAGLAVLAKTVGMVVSVLGFLWSAIQPVILIIRILAIVFGGIPVAIAAVVAALIWFLTQTETGRAILSAIWEGIKTAISAAIDGIVAAFNWVIQALQTAWTFIQTAAQGIWTAISTAFGAVVAFVTTVFTTVWTVISTYLNLVWTIVSTIFQAIWTVISTVLQTIWDFIVMVFEAIKTVIEVAMNIIMEIWSRIWPLLMLPIRVFYGLVILIWEALIAAISAALDAIFSVVSTVWNAVSSFITGVMNAIWNFIKTVWKGITDAISDAVNAAKSVITSIWNAIWGFLKPIIQGIWDFIKSAWNGITSAISGALSAIWSVISSIWNNVSSFISSVVGAIVSRVTQSWNNITSAISGAMNAVWGIIQSVWNNVVNFVQGALSRIGGIITNIWGGLESVGSGIVSGLKGALNAVIGAVNTVIGGINWAIGAANKLPGPDIPTIPTIPRLAKGGVVSPRGGGTLAMIAEAGRPERVEPLDPQGLSKRDRALIEFLAGGSGEHTVNVYLGTRELIELVDVVVEEKQDGLADRVLTGTKG